MLSLAMRYDKVHTDLLHSCVNMSPWTYDPEGFFP